MTNPGPWKPNQPQTGQAPTPQSEPSKRSGCLKWGLIGIAVLFVLILIAGIAGGGDDESDTATDTTTGEDATAAEVAAPDEIDEPAEPAPPADPGAELTATIQDQVEGAEVTLHENQIDVAFPMADNLTTGLMATGAQRDTLSIITAVKESDWSDTPYLRLEITADTTDEFGNASSSNVVMATYFPETLAQINPDGIQQSNVWQVADERMVHPDLQG